MVSLHKQVWILSNRSNFHKSAKNNTKFHTFIYIMYGTILTQFYVLAKGSKVQTVCHCLQMLSHFHKLLISH